MTFVTLELVLLDDGDLTQVPGSAALHQRNISCQTHPVDMVPGLSVVKSIQHDVELLEPVSVVLVLHDGAVQRLNLTLGSKPQRCLPGTGGLGLTHMLLLKQELSVQIGDIDCVQINDGDVFKA